MPINIPESENERIVIVGAGFAGMNLAKKLINSPYQVVLIDKNNYHLFQPLLYQVAMSGLEPSSISFPLRKAFQHCKNVTIRCAEVTAIDSDKKRIETNCGYVNYDKLVLAYGTQTNYFGNSNFIDNAIPLKRIAHALFLRNNILSDLEIALMTRNFDERQNYIDIVIVGGGPTGVEIAGALAEMKKFILPKDYPELDSKEMDIFLIQGADRLLPAMSDNAGTKALKFLTKLGVKVQTSTRVMDIIGNKIVTDKGELYSHKVIWAAGVTCQHIDGLSKAEFGWGNRLKTDMNCQILGYDDVYALGDISFMVNDTDDGNAHPQVAQVAIQQGKHLAKYLLKKTDKLFVYKDLGSMATIGRNKAVCDLPKIKFSGFSAWMLWLFIHIAGLIGWRNRTIVFVNWLWNYMTYDQSLRLIIRPFNHSKIDEKKINQ